MKSRPNNYYDLAVVDPPYFSGPEKRAYYGRKSGASKHSKTGKIHVVNKVDYGVSDEWEVPGPEYFDELQRVSVNQIVWGCNYYDYNFGAGRLIWDKVNGNTSFSDCEIAYVSMHDSTRLFAYMWNGMMQGKSITEGRIQQGDKSKNEKRIHPTQKPVALYSWILKKYAKKNFKLLDTHSGSGSFRIAAYNYGFRLDSCEKDLKHCNSNNKRYDNHISQKELFSSSDRHEMFIEE